MTFGTLQVERFLFRTKRKVDAISPMPSMLNPVRQHLFSTARPCSSVWQVAKVEIREVVRQVPKVEVSRQRRRVHCLSLPCWPIPQVKYVEKKVPKQVIQYAARLIFCASTSPPTFVLVESESHNPTISSYPSFCHDMAYTGISSCISIV